jgi:hypothetical protein
LTRTTAEGDNRRHGGSAVTALAPIRIGGWLVQELLPIGCGVLLGALARGIRPSLRWPIGVVLTIGLGVMASVVSGEAAISWAFVLIDIPMVAVAASVGFLVAHRLDRATRKTPEGGT